MSKAKIFIPFSLIFCNFAFGLEFGAVSTMSAGMGGAGVALKDNDNAIYYNPALIGASSRINKYIKAKSSNHTNDDSVTLIGEVNKQNLDSANMKIYNGKVAYTLGAGIEIAGGRGRG